jgi:hypothetical protein
MPDPNQQRSSNVALSELPAKTTDRLSRIAISQAPATSQRSIPFYKPPGLSRVSQVTGGPPSLRQQTPPPHQSSPTKSESIPVKCLNRVKLTRRCTISGHRSPIKARRKFVRDHSSLAHCSHPNDQWRSNGEPRTHRPASVQQEARVQETEE